MNAILGEARFNFIAQENKAFILAFDEAMDGLGYGFGDTIGSGYCWGKYMLIYTKTGVMSEKVVARIYIREASIVLRLFFSNIDKHRPYIEKAPAYIKDVFTGEHGDCQHCHNEKDGQCRFRKTYTIDNRVIEKCNGIVFEFHSPSVEKLPGYISLFTEFYPRKKAAA